MLDMSQYREKNKSEIVEAEINWTSRQEKIINDAILLEEESFIVEGGPGTGKTLIAIEVAKRLAKRDIVLHLMYNVPLSQYIEQRTVLPQINNVTVLTYHKWIYRFLKDYSINVPNVEGASPYDVDWDRIENLLDNSNVGTIYDIVITDETQDFPIGLLRILHKLSERMICFIDPNQSYEKDKTSLDELKTILAVKDIFHLTDGYRTTRQIMDAANIFKTNKESTHNSEKRGSYPKMICCNSSSDAFLAQNQKIISLIKKNPNKDIGIIVNAYNMGPLKHELDNYNIEYTSFKGGEGYSDKFLDFSKKGVKLVSFGTMKGLSFDIVIIPNVEWIKSKGDTLKDKNLLYVAMTRASEELFLLYQSVDSDNLKWTTAAREIERNKVLFDWEEC